MNWLLLAILGYLAVQIAIGAVVAPRIRTEEDYLVAGRRLGYPLTIFSIFATWFGAETMLASSARAHTEGLVLTTAEPFGYGLCLVLLGLVFAVPLWNRKLTTFADFFRQRFSPGVERITALILVPSSILWAAAQLRGFGHVLTTVTSLDTGAAVAIAAGFCVAYTMMGGLLADAITDLLQGIVLIIGLAVLAVAVVLARGGVGPTLAVLGSARIGFAAPGAVVSPLGVLEEWAIPICGSVVAAEMISRVIAARSPAVARNGAVIAGGAYIAVGLVPLFIGLASAGIHTPLEATEQFLPALAQRLLPAAFYVVFAGGLISAILSTVDTILLVTSGLVSHNLIAPALGITDERRKLLMARTGVVVFGAVSWVLAVRAQGIAALVESASSFGSAGVLVVLTGGLFTARGGPMTATVTLLGALAVYLAGAWGGAPYPFITSLASAAALYAGGAVAQALRGRIMSPAAGT